jgi:pilus assembly protein CpaC
VAERYAPGAVTNLLSIGSSQQVLLEVRFAEVARNALADLGANFFLSYNNGNGSYGLASGAQAGGPLVGGPIPNPLFGVPPTSFGGIAGQLTDNLSYNLQASINALEQKGLLRTLAQPNLVALSGDTASFLAGGQIPIPVAQTTSGNAIPVLTVEFKDFGVSLAFTPTVVGKEQINLELSSEVSAIDPTLSVRTGDVVVPGLKVRRARTTIELKDGQSFSIAGLLQDNFQDGVNQLPVLGSIPILGTLFRSTNYQHQQTELVVLITTHLVEPGVVRSLVTPADAVVLPNPVTLFGNGKTEGGSGANAGGAAAGSAPANGYVLP